MIKKNARTAKAVQSDYDRSAVEYDRMRFGSLGGKYVDEREQAFVAGVIKSSEVLEVGTSTGRFAVSLVKREARYTGVDLSLKMLRTTLERSDRLASVIQMDAGQLGLRSYFDYVLCIRTFHFLEKPHEALKGMRDALKPGGLCLITFETDNFLRRLMLFFGIGTSEQYYYRVSDVEEMLLTVEFKIDRSGSVMRIPVTFYRKCPRQLMPVLKRLERLWPWPMHGYVLGSK